MAMRRLPAVGTADLWLVDLDAPLRGTAACLSEEEHARAARFHRAHDRHRYMQAHIALRRILGQVVATAPGQLVFGSGPAGKPHLPAHPTCRFNLSHSGHQGLVAVSLAHEIGVDLEVVRPIDDRAAMARQHFDNTECAAVTEDRDGTLAFLSGWTRKEACLKAIGTGLDRDLRTVSTGCSMARRSLRLAIDGACASVTVESFMHDGEFVASVAHLESRLPSGQD